MHVRRNLCSKPGSGVRAGKRKIAVNHASPVGGAVVRASCLKQRQASDVTTQLFGVARVGDIRLFKSLLRKNKRAAADINFQYSARVAEKGWGNLWPWYWCINTHDAQALCWGAPSGVEPEHGDTLLIITLKIGMEKHAKHLLSHQDLDLGVKNSSGQDAARVAAMYGREWLSPRLHASYTLHKQQHQQVRRALRNGMKESRPKRQRHSRHRSNQLFDAHRSSAPDYPNAESTTPGSRPCRSDVTLLDELTDQEKLENPTHQQVVSTEENIHTISRGGEPSAVDPGELHYLAGGRENICNGIEADVDQQGEGYKLPSSGTGDGTPRQPPRTSKVHSCQRETRVVGVQTDPDLVGLQCTAVRATAGLGHERADKHAEVVDSAPPPGCRPDDDRLDRRSTPPEDNSSDLQRAEPSAQSCAGPGNETRFKRSHVVLNNVEMDPATNVVIQQARVEEGHSPASTNGNNDVATPSLDIPSSAQVYQYDIGVSSNAPLDKRKTSSRGSGDEIQLIAAPGSTDVPVRQYETQDPMVVVGGDLANRKTSSSNAGDPPPGSIAKVDEVTRELQKIIREDALQDDGSFDYHPAFEVFDVDQDGILTPDELHSTFIRLGMESMLDAEGIAMVIERWPRDDSGFITQKELQLFADRPAEVPWPLCRGPNGHVAGRETATDVETGVAISLALHELQVIAGLSPGGVFSWKKAFKDLSSVAMLVRISRGHHVVESAAVFPRLLSANDDAGLGDGSPNAKRSTGPHWSWRWEEILALPGTLPAESESRPPSLPWAAGSNPDDYQAVGLEDETRIGGVSRTGYECLADPMATFIHNNGGPNASLGGKGTSETKDTTVPTSEALPSETVDFVSRVLRPGDRQGSRSPRDSDTSPADENGSTKANSTVNNTEGNESPRMIASIDGMPGGSGAIGGNIIPHEICGGEVKKKRGVTFWTPRKGPGKGLAKNGRGLSSSKEESTGTGVESSVQADDAATGSDGPVDSSSSSSLDIRGEGREPGANEEEVSVDTISSDGSCPEVSVRVSDTVAGGGSPAKAEVGRLKKRRMPFWGNRKVLPRKSDTTTVAKQHKDVLSTWNGEASVASGSGDQEQHGTGERDYVESGGDSVTSKSTALGLGKAGRGSFWNLVRDGSVRRMGKRGGVDGNKNQIDPESYNASGRQGTAAEMPSHIPGSTTKKVRGYENFRRRIGRAPFRGQKIPDVIVLEIWKVAGSPPLKSRVTNADAADALLEGERRTRQTKTDSLEEAGTADCASDRSDSSEGSPPAHTPTEHMPLFGPTLESPQNSPRAICGTTVLHSSQDGGRGGRGDEDKEVSESESTPQQECADHYNLPLKSVLVVAGGDGSTIGKVASKKHERSKRLSIFSSPFKGRGSKNTGPPKTPLASGSFQPPFMPVTPRDSSSAVDGGDFDDRKSPTQAVEGGQQMLRTVLYGVKGMDAGEAAVAAWPVPDVTDVAEESGTEGDNDEGGGGGGGPVDDDDGEDGDDDDDGDGGDDGDASFVSKVSIASEVTAVSEASTKKQTRKGLASIFLSPVQGKKSLSPFTRQRSRSEYPDGSPRERGGLTRPLPSPTGRTSAGDTEQVLWGRLAFPVAELLLPATRENEPDTIDEHMIDGQNPLNQDDSNTNGGANSKRRREQPLAGESSDKATFGVGVYPHRTRPKKAVEGETAVQAAGDETLANVRVAETVSVSQTGSTPSSDIERWFEVKNPKRKHGRAKGRIRLSLTCADRKSSVTQKAE